MKLETLEIVIEANLEKFQKVFDQITPIADKAMSTLGRSVNKGTDDVGKNMDVSEGAKRFEKQMEQMTSFLNKQMKLMVQQSESSSSKIGNGITKGVSRARSTANKDIDGMVREINQKMNQANAKQRQVSLLKTERKSSVNNGDNKSVVKYDNQIATAQAQMIRYHETAKQLARSMQMEFNEVPIALDNIANKMMQNEGQIDSMRSKLRTMQEDYQKAQVPKGSFSSGFSGAEDTSASLKIQEKIMAQTSKMNKLIQESEALQRAYSAVEDRAQLLEPAIAKLNTSLGQQSSQAETAGTAIQQYGRMTEGSRGLISRFTSLSAGMGGLISKSLGKASSSFNRFKSLFSNGSNQVSKQSRNMSVGVASLGNRMSGILKQVFVFSVIYKGLQMLGSGLMNALNSNEEFSNSLNQIKVNLLTAFYPIYQSILPAINALMTTLSKATAVFASFIATLFGTTYSAAKQGASGLYESVRAMNDSGSAADKNKEKIKQMQRSLMGFDEINNLSTNQNSDEDSSASNSKPSVDFSIPNQQVPDWVTGWAAQAKKVWKDFFKPIQDAWNKHGKKVMDAWKFALNEVWELTKSVGRSFMTVWTNGSGEKVISNILLIIRDIGLIVGNLASQFNKAWNEADVGTRIFQSLFDILNIILGSIQRMTSATVEWAEKLNFTPLLESIATLLAAIEPITQNVFDGIAWAYENILLPLASFVIEDALPAFFDLLSAALTVLNSTIEALKPLFKWLWDNMLQPIAEWTGGVIVGVLGDITDALTALSDWITKHQKTIETIAVVIGSIVASIAILKAALAIGAVIKTITSVVTILGTLINSVGVLQTVITLLAPIIGALSWPIIAIGAAIAAVIAIGVLLWKNWDVVKEKAGEIWNSISEAIGGFLSTIGEYVSDFFEAGKNFIGGLLGGIGEALSNIGTWMQENIFDPIVNGFKSLFGIHSPSTVFAEFGGFLIEGLYGGIKAIISKPVELIGTLWNNMKTSVSTKTSEIWNKSKDLWGKTGNAIKDAATSSGKWISDKWKDISKGTSNTFGNVAKWTSDKWGAAKKSVTDNAKSIWDNTKSRWSDVTINTKKVWDDFSNKVSSTTRNAKDNASNRMNDLKNNLRNRFSETWSNARNTWDNIQSKISTQSSKSNTKASSSFSTMRSNMTTSLVSLRDKTKEIFDKIANWATDLPSRIAKGLRNGIQAIKDAASSIGNGIVGIIGKAMNGVISGINWVLDRVGASKSKLTPWEIPKYATGTGYHPGGFAQVNDAPGTNYQEAYHLPTGETGLFPKQRNMVVNLPKGASVLSGQRTASMLKGMPAYANGIGDWFKEKWNGAKQIASDFWSYASNPGKLLNVAVSKFVNLSDTFQPALDMAKGTVATVASGATKWVTDKFNAGHKKHQESLETAYGAGAFAPRFKNPPFAMTANYGSYDGETLYGRTVHKGIDFGAALGTPLTAQNSGTVSYAGWASGYGKLVAIKVADSLHALYGHMNSIGVSLGRSLSQGDYIGTLGNTGDSTGPHVHYELRKGGVFGTSVNPWTYGQTDTLSTGALSGVQKFAPSVSRWQGTVERALSILGLLNTANVNATLNQIRTESNGNPNAINNWDINAKNGIPSKGLMQVIDPTFRSYSRSPYNKNIWDPLSNILASMRYATSIYGSLTNAYKGVGYENGGWVTKEGMYRIGEGNKREMIVPVDKPSVAMERISQIFDYMGVNWTNPSLEIPTTFKPDQFTQKSANFANDKSVRYEGGGMQQSFEAMINGIMMAITSMGGQPQQAPNGDIIINIGGKEFGRIAVKEINKYHQQLGYTELNI